MTKKINMTSFKSDKFGTSLKICQTLKTKTLENIISFYLYETNLNNYTIQ